MFSLSLSLFSSAHMWQKQREKLPMEPMYTNVLTPDNDNITCIYLSFLHNVILCTRMPSVPVCSRVPVVRVTTLSRQTQARGGSGWRQIDLTVIPASLRRLLNKKIIIITRSCLSLSPDYRPWQSVDGVTPLGCAVLRCGQWVDASR